MAHLGFLAPAEAPVEAVEAVEAVETPLETPPAPITAEDLFASASPLSSEPPASEAPTSEPPASEAPGSEAPGSEALEAWEERAKAAVVVGDFTRAVEACFAAQRYADALVMAAWGGAELLAAATVRPRRGGERRSATCARRRARCCARWRRS